MKRNLYKSSKSSRILVYALLLTLLFIALPLTIGLLSKSNVYKYTAEAATAGNIYGISAGDVVHNMDDVEINAYFDDIKSMGVEWVRLDFSWAHIQWDSPTTYNWSRLDAAVNAANVRGIKVLGVLAYVPPWALPSGCTDNWRCPPADNAAFTNFVTTTVTRYAPMSVHVWEFWNEPNNGTMNPVTYTTLLKLVYPAVKAVDATAVVLAGGSMPAETAGNTYSPIDFLTSIYANGGKNYFDAVAHHPYCWGSGASFNCPSTYADWSAWSQMQDTNLSIRSVMAQNNDSAKKIWATEYGGPTAGGSLAMPEAQQAQSLIDSYNLWTSYTWSGPLFWYELKDSCTDTSDTECFFGMIRSDGTHKASYDAYKTVALAVTPTLTPTSGPTSTPVPASVTVTSLSKQGSSSKSPITANYTLQTTGSLPVENLVVAVRKNNVGYDFPVQPAIVLSGQQSFSVSRNFAKGTYTYWVAYYKNGNWKDLSPTKSFTVK